MKLFWMKQAEKMAGEHIFAKTMNVSRKQKKTKALERSLKIKVSDEIYNELEKEMNSFDR